MIIDTDMGGDDWLAILYILAEPSIQIKAITINGTGLGRSEPSSNNLFHILDIACADPIPVALGSDQPRSGNNTFPNWIRDQTDDFQGLTVRHSNRTVKDISAPQLINQVIEKSDERVTILVLGPMTNLATALVNNPALADRIDRVVAMAGAIETPGNLIDLPGFKTSNNTAEWNVYLDPKAMEIVMNSINNLILIPLDATKDVPANGDLVSRIRKSGHSEASNFVANTIEGWRELDGRYSTYMWDPVAAMYLVRPEFIATKKGRLTIDSNPDSITAGNLTLTHNGTTLSYGVKADQRSFENSFVEAISKNFCESGQH